MTRLRDFFLGGGGGAGLWRGVALEQAEGGGVGWGRFELQKLHFAALNYVFSAA